MSRLTYKKPDGTWGMNNGFDMHKVPSELYGALWKLHQYEETGLNQEEVAYVSEDVNSFVDLEDAIEIVKQEAEKFGTDTNVGTNGWIPVSERLPEESLNSVIGWDEYRERCCFVQYIGGRWFLGNDIDSVKIIAWQPLPEPFQPKGE